MLAKKYRITTTKDFQNIFKKGGILFNPFLNIKFLPTQLSNSRFGIIVSTKISKKATVRNKIKRQLRAIIYKNLANIKQNYDIIILTKPAITTQTITKIESNLIYLLKKAGLLK